MFYGDELKAYAEVTVSPLVLIANVLTHFWLGFRVNPKHPDSKE
jgi:hypothetical protein